MALPRLAHTEPGVTNTGSSGFLTLSAAQPLAPGSFVLASELAAGVRGGRAAIGPGPLAIGVGLPPTMEASFSLREPTMTRDRRREVGILRLALKVNILPGGEGWPAIAFEAYGDYLQRRPILGARALITSYRSGAVQVGLAAGYHSGRARSGAGPEGGAVVSYLPGEAWEWLGEVSVEGQRPWGVLVGAGARRRVLPYATLSLGLRWGVVGPAGARAVLGLSLHSSLAAASEPRPQLTPVAPTVRPAFTTERPRFRLRIPMRQLPTDTGYRPLAPEGVDDAKKR